MALILQGEVQMEVARHFAVFCLTKAEGHAGELEFADLAGLFARYVGIQDIHVEVPHVTKLMGKYRDCVALRLSCDSGGH